MKPLLPIAQAVTREQALEALDAMDDYARMDTGVDAKGPREVLRRFIEGTAASPAPDASGVREVPRG